MSVIVTFVDARNPDGGSAVAPVLLCETCKKPVGRMDILRIGLDFQPRGVAHRGECDKRTASRSTDFGWRPVGEFLDQLAFNTANPDFAYTVIRSSVDGETS